ARGSFATAAAAGVDVEARASMGIEEREAARGATIAAVARWIAATRGDVAAASGDEKAAADGGDVVHREAGERAAHTAIALRGGRRAEMISAGAGIHLEGGHAAGVDDG